MTEHKIDHNDLTTRTWVCTNCGCSCLSKNPWSRNTHGEGPGGILPSMYLQHLRNVSSANMLPARPPRPKEEPMVMDRDIEPLYHRHDPYCIINYERDIALYITPDVSIRDTGKPLVTPAQQLLKFFKLIREVDQAVLDGYVCAELGGGHKWTDDPAEIARFSKKEEEQ